ncbi:MAG: hypothetical protein K2F59_03285 [Eubacteriales bacterium]|nr:hypothetical protein [Eubacteriales bacterium]
MFDEVIYLVLEKKIKDEYGIVKSELVKRNIFAKRKSISQKEYFSQNANTPFLGLRRAYRFEVAKMEYNNEELLEFNNEIYTIYRTHENGNIIELYTELRGSNF